MDDGRIPLVAARVAEVAQASSHRLSRIAGLLLLVGFVLTVGFLSMIGRLRDPLSAIQVLPTTVAFWGLAFERMGKAKAASRAAKQAAADPASSWFLDGYRVFAGSDPKPAFRVSKKMRAELTAMPRATLVAK
jgi:hypothetical protein